MPKTLLGNFCWNNAEALNETSQRQDPGKSSNSTVILLSSAYGCSCGRLVAADTGGFTDSGGLARELAEENDTSAMETVAIRVMPWSEIWLHLPHVLRIWEKLNLKITVCSGRTFDTEWCILAAAEEHPRASSGSTREADTPMVQQGPGYTLSWHQNLTMPYHPPHGTGVQSLKNPRLRVLWKATEAKGAFWEVRK